MKKDHPSKNPSNWDSGDPVKTGWLDQYEYFREIFQKISSISGAVIECGLGLGDSFIMLANHIGRENAEAPRELFGFDSFEGWPAPTSYDESPRNPQKGEWAYPQEDFEARVTEAGIYKRFPNLKVVITPGFLADSLPSSKAPEIALLHIDVDLYEGYRDALQYLFPHVAPGGVVMFDEYRYFSTRPGYIVGGKQIEKWPGCTKAVDDYFADRPEKPTYHDATRKFYVVKEV